MYRTKTEHKSLGTSGRFLESSSNLPGSITIFLNVFSPITQTVITYMVLGQWFHRIIRF